MLFPAALQIGQAALDAAGIAAAERRGRRRDNVVSDVLSDILDTIHLAGTLYFRTDFSAPWVVQGRCNVSFASGQQVNLQAGDLILIPKGRAHVLADSAGRPAAPLEQVIK